MLEFLQRDAFLNFEQQGVVDGEEKLYRIGVVKDRLKIKLLGDS